LTSKNSPPILPPRKRKFLSKIAKYTLEKGLRILSGGHYGNVLRTMMPLVITDEQMGKGVSILDDAFASLTK
jgi:4-aminobutyrate aminotransferase/(S)-3-amino-2-methylpropionate transaminase